MKIFPPFHLLILSSVTGIGIGMGAKADVVGASWCPDDSSILPCICEEPDEFGGMHIECQGSLVDQKSIENSFRELRRANGIPDSSGFYIEKFTLADTELTQFDLAPLYGSQMDKLNILRNKYLTKLVTSGNSSGNPRGQDKLTFVESINVYKLRLSEMPIKREGFGDALQYFSDNMIYFEASKLDLDLDLDLAHNIEEGQFKSESEFLPGFSALTNLTYLDLTRCGITGRLNSSTFNFDTFPKLEYVGLRQNGIQGIGENVFPSLKELDLCRNQLDETLIHPNSGLANQTGSGSGTELHLESNQLKTLPSEIFQPFLDANPANQLYLDGNPLICDKKLSWIKARRAEFQKRVEGAICENDPGHTVFNSHLIPEQNYKYYYYYYDLD